MSKYIKKGIVLFGMVLFGVLFFAKVSLAATYYVDATGGLDSNSGTSQSSSWKTIAKVNSLSFQPGDSILFKRGDVWREKLVPPSSGSSGNPITFGAYGTGENPTISGAVIPQVSQWLNIYGNVWTASDPVKPFQVLFNGVKGIQVTVVPANPLEWGWDETTGVLYVYSAGNPATTYTNPGVEVGYFNLLIDINENRSYITIDGLTIERENSWASIMIRDKANHVTVKNCVIRYGAHAGIQIGLYLAGNTNTDILIENNDVYGNYNWGIVTYATVASPGQEIVIRNNRVYSNPSTNGSPIDIGSSYTIIENNQIYDNGSDGIIGGTSGIHLFNDSQAGMPPGREYGDNNIVRYNIIYNQKGYPSDAEGILMDVDCDNNQIYYNIIFNNNGACISSFKSMGNSILNNTCYNNVKNPNSWPGSNTGEIVLWDDVAVDKTANTTVKNNVLFSVQPGAYAISIQGIITDNPGINISNNLLYRTSGNWYFDGTAGSDLNTWNAKSFVGTDLFGDPGFINPMTDFYLQSTSPAINAGTNVGLTRDYAGTLVPQGSAPDVGAYEYVPPPDTTPPAAPTGVVVS